MNTLSGLMAVLLTIVLAATWYTFRGYCYWKKYHDQRFPRALLSDLYPLPEDSKTSRAAGVAGPKLKTGDIILHVAHACNFSNYFLTLDLFSHGGMVVEDGAGHFYTSEATLGGELAPADSQDRPPASRPAVTMAQNAEAHRLLTRIKYYPGSCFVLRLNKPLDSARVETLRHLAFGINGLPYPRIAQGVASAIASFFGLRKAKRTRYCMEHVAWLADSAGLTPLALIRKNKTLLGAGFFQCARSVSQLGGVRLPDGYRYLEPVQILYDLDVLGRPNPAKLKT